MALTRPRYSQIYDTDYKQSVRLATTADVGNLLASGSITNSVDGTTVAVDDRILVKNQADPKQNGIWRVVTVGTGSNGTWVRALDADANTKITSGMTTTVSEGSANLYKTYKLATPDPISVGQTELTFVDPFAASGAAGANTQVQFNDLSSAGASSAFTFNKVGNILTVSGNIVSSSGYFIGNGSQLSGIDATSIQSGTSSVKAYNSGNVTVSAAGSANVLVVTSSNIHVSGSVLPTANVTYDLGSPTRRWREGWFSGSTIHIGNESISVDNNGKWTFTSDGAAVELGKNNDFNPPNASVSGNVSAGSYTWSNGVSIFSTINSAISGSNTALKGYVDSGSTIKANLSNPTFTGTLTAADLVVNNDLDVTGNLLISGNLTIAGNATTLNTDNLVLTDPMIYMGEDNPSDLVDLGIVSSFKRAGLYQHAGFVRDATDGIWKIFENVEPEPTTTVDFGSATYASLKTGNVMTTGNIVVGANLRLTGALLNSAGLGGTSGQYLVSTGTGVAWTDLSISTNSISEGNASVIADGNIVNVAVAGTNVASFSSAGLAVSANSSTFTDTVTASTTNKVLRVVNGSSDVWMSAKLGPGSYNPIVGANDAAIVFSNGSQNQGNLVIAPWSTTTFGMKFVANTNTIQVPGILSLNSNNNTVAIANGGTNGTGNIGASGAAFNTIFAKATSAQYADLAEIYASDRNYVPGTVVVFGGEKEVTVSLTSHDPSIAGVVSTDPAYLMNDTVEGVAVALQGRVPCRVLGPVSKGDRVVSSDVRGVAERLDMTKYQPGCIIGKSLESVPDGEIATIEVVVGRN
jgi:hypothetical protein